MLSVDWRRFVGMNIGFAIFVSVETVIVDENATDCVGIATDEIKKE